MFFLSNICFGAYKKRLGENICYHRQLIIKIDREKVIFNESSDCPNFISNKQVFWKNQSLNFRGFTVRIIKLYSELFLKIEIQIFGLHWRMQNISFLMSLRSPLGFKKPNVLHHPVQAKNLNFNSCI